MTNLSEVDSGSNDLEVKNVLERSKRMLGRIPNMIGAMASSPAVADLYLSIQTSFQGFSLPPEFIELIAVTVAEANSCYYCLCAHHAKAKRYGIARDDLDKARLATSGNAKTAVALEFVKDMIVNRCENMPNRIDLLKSHGWNEAEISEIITVATLNIFPNYFNKLNETELDFPALEN